MPILLIAGLLGGIYFFMPSEYDKLMHKALMVKNEKPNETVFDGFPEPQLPNQKENEKTILGIDSDNNGIRDDIDIWINRTGKNYNERMALRQLARANQEKLRICEIEEYSKSSDACQKASKALDCTYTLFNQNIVETYTTFKELTINTNKRQSCMKFYNRANCSSSSNFELKYNNCEFKVQ